MPARAELRGRSEAHRLVAVRDSGLRRLRTTTKTTSFAAVALAGALAAFVASNAPGRKSTAGSPPRAAPVRAGDDSGAVSHRRHVQRSSAAPAQQSQAPVEQAPAPVQQAPAPPPAPPVQTEQTPVVVSGGS